MKHPNRVLSADSIGKRSTSRLPLAYPVGNAVIVCGCGRMTKIACKVLLTEGFTCPCGRPVVPPAGEKRETRSMAARRRKKGA
jgi:hypothetical protein